MKIEPSKSAKLPKYAAALAASAALLTSCVDPEPIRTQGLFAVDEEPSSSEPDLMIAGEESLDPDYTQTEETTKQTETETTCISTTEEVLELGGDVVFMPEEDGE
ncbi:MAG: hypothetical protein MJ071_05240 [Oscillospiraceae bacterium]|nr:hypothetical protein [Oscillospiraceae bacterium]